MKQFYKALCTMMLPFAIHTSASAQSVTFTSSNLPIVIIQTEQAINADEKVRGTMKIINNGVGETNHVTDTPNDYDGYIGIKWRGESSLNFNQKKYTIETWDEAGNDIDVSLLGMPEEADWVLLAPYNDVSMVRDVFAYYMWNEMGHWGPRTQMCEAVVNGEYMGVYALCERIKRNKNRIDISKLKPEDIEGRDVTGGYILRIDAYDEEDETFQSKVKGIQVQQNWGWGGTTTTTIEAPITWTIYYPKKEDIQPEQRAYIQDYVDQTEQAIQADNFADPEEGYAHFINVESFVDYFIHTELSLNADGFKRSAYYYKEKDKKDGSVGKLFAGPVWDFNLAYGNCSFCNANKVESWVYEGCETNPTPVMWRRLLEDPTFRNAVKCRYLALRQTILSEESIDAFLDSYAALLDEAKDRQFAEIQGNPQIQQSLGFRTYLFLCRLSRLLLRGRNSHGERLVPPATGLPRCQPARRMHGNHRRYRQPVVGEYQPTDGRYFGGSPFRTALGANRCGQCHRYPAGVPYRGSAKRSHHRLKWYRLGTSHHRLLCR